MPTALFLENLARGGHCGSGWRLVLKFRRSRDEEGDCQAISCALPWIFRIEGSVWAVSDLRERGLAVIECGDEGEARRLFGEVRGFKVSVSVFDARGRRAPWEHEAAALGDAGRASRKSRVCWRSRRGLQGD